MPSEGEQPLHWPDDEPTQRVEVKQTRYQRAVRFMQEAFGVGGVATSLGTPRNQDPMKNVIGIGLSADRSREANSADEPKD
jgi:hypothetical protein